MRRAPGALLVLALAAGPSADGLEGQDSGRPRGLVAGAAEAVPVRFLPFSPRLRPIRTNSPGTGVFIGSGILARVFWDRRSSEGVELEDATAVVDLRYTPATHWVVGARVPVVLSRVLRGPEIGSPSTSGVGSLSLGIKHRFYRSVGRWSDRHAAVEVEMDLPVGRVDPDLPSALDPFVRDRLRPSTGSVDWALDLVYQEGRRRFVYGADALYRRSGEGEGGYRRGDAARFSFDLEYILYPFEYRRPGDEVFLLLEGALLRHGEDALDGRTVPGTGRSELLLAPGIQHVATERMLLSASLQFPVWSDLGDRELERDFNFLAEIRRVF